MANHPAVIPAVDYGDEIETKDMEEIEELRTTSFYRPLSSLLGSEKFSDMRIRCGGREFPAHRAIVCPQSSFFDAALTSGFVETHTRIVELPEDDPDVLERFLQFLYTGTYEDGVIGAWTSAAEASMITPEEVKELLATAPGTTIGPGSEDGEDSDYYPDNDQYTMDDFQNFPEDDFDEDDFEEDSLSDEEQEDEEMASSSEGSTPEEQRMAEAAEELKFLATSPESGDEDPQHDFSEADRQPQALFLPLRLFIMADKYDVPSLKLFARERFRHAAEMLWESVDYFPDLVDELYSNTPEQDGGMRSIVCRLVGLTIVGPEQRQRFAAVMHKHGDFAAGVMNYWLDTADIFRARWV
ncbi:BTB/POZ protein [Chaetomium sp. MPI-SDFR-AT-0129]|nr:BTB/POZ protein [Chaetomium sp. MPI-SDFR-AT-0129]